MESYKDAILIEVWNLQKLYEDASQVASDAVGSIRTIASFSAEDKVVKQYQKKCEDPIKAGITQGLYSGAGYGLAIFLQYSVYATAFYAGARLIEAGKTTFGEVFKVCHPSEIHQKTKSFCSSFQL